MLGTLDLNLCGMQEEGYLTLLVVRKPPVEVSRGYVWRGDQEGEARRNMLNTAGGK